MLLLPLIVFQALAGAWALGPPAEPLHPPTSIDAFKADVKTFIANKDYQPVLAFAALVFGVTAVINGNQFFKLLVVIALSTLTCCLTVKHLEEMWIGGQSNQELPASTIWLAITVAAVEVGLFVGIVTHKGWEGTQLVLGAVLGAFFFHNVEGLALAQQSTQLLAENVIFKVGACTAAVALGIWMIHPKLGGARVLGILSPIFGASLVVSAMGFFAMFACTYPKFRESMAKGQDPINAPNVLPSQVPSVVEFWYSIVFPWSTPAVGVFTAAGYEPVVGGNKIQMDRALGIFFWVLIAFMAIQGQWKSRSVSAREEEATPSNMQPLLPA